MTNNLSDQTTAAEIAHQFGPYTQDGDAFRIACPAHGGDDHNLKIWDDANDDGSWRLGANCWSHECEYKDIMAALGLTTKKQSQPEAKKKKPKKKNSPPKKSAPIEVKKKNLIAVYQHPDGNPRPVYRTDHDGMCGRKNCDKNEPHKHIWGPGGSKGCYLLPWGNDDPNNILVLVEGEKSAKALQDALESTNTKGYTSVSWRGGAKNAKDANYELCKGRTILCWPDDDTPGRKAMKEASQAAVLTGARKVLGIPTKGETKKDAADFSPNKIIEILKKRARPVKVEGVTGMSVEDSPAGLQEALNDYPISVWYNEREDSFNLLDRIIRNTELMHEDVSDMKIMNDNARAALRVEVSMRYVFEKKTSNQVVHKPAYFSEDKFGTTLRYLGHHNSFDPVKVWFESLPPWDEKPRIEKFFSTLFEVRDQAIAAWAGRAIFIGGIVRTYEPGSMYDRYPVLVGAQGITKSSTISTLVPNYKWYTDSLEAGADEKVTIERAGSALLVEFPELSGVRKWELGRLKKFLAKTHDKARRAWGRETTDMPRRWIGIGTANTQSYGILPNDETGQRRFTIVDLEPKKYDFKAILYAIEHRRDQLWAEALHIYRQAVNAGENPVLTYRIPKELEKESEKLAHQYAIKDENAYEIALLATDNFIGGHPYSMQEIFVEAGVFAEADANEKMPQLRRLATDVGQELRILGWTRDSQPRTMKGKRKRWWISPESKPLVN